MSRDVIFTAKPFDFYDYSHGISIILLPAATYIYI